MRVKGTLFAITWLLLAGCETLRVGHPLTLVSGDRTTDGGLPDRSNTTDEAPSPPLDLRWDYETEGGYGPASPLIAGGFVIVSSRAGNVDVVELLTGKKVGRTSMGEAIEGAPVLVNGRLLIVPVAAGKHGLVAYDLASGSRTWVLDDNPHAAGLLLAGGTLIAAALDGTVRGIDPLNGTESWSMQPDPSRAIYAAPVEISTNLAAVADDAGGVVALNPTTGDVAWTRELAAPIMRSPSASGGRLFVPTTLGQLHALDATTGETLWSYSDDSHLARFATPAVDNRYVIFGATDGVLRCLEPESGELFWAHRFDGAISAAPLIAGQVVYVGTMDERIAALDSATGELLWEDELPGRVKSGLAARNNILIVLSEPKFVHAFDAQRIASTSSGD